MIAHRCRSAVHIAAAVDAIGISERARIKIYIHGSGSTSRLNCVVLIRICVIPAGKPRGRLGLVAAFAVVGSALAPSR